MEVNKNENESKNTFQAVKGANFLDKPHKRFFY